MYSKSPFSSEVNLGETYERGQQLVHDFRRVKNIRNRISMLERAKQRTYQQYFKLMTKVPVEDGGMKINSEATVFYYHKDQETHNNLAGIDESFMRMAKMESRKTNNPVILSRGCDKVTVVIQLTSKNSNFSKKIRKVCNKLDNVILETQRLRTESENITIDAEQGKYLLNKFHEKYRELKNNYDSINQFLKEVRETKNILQKKYQQKISRMQPELKEMARCGFRFDVFKEWFYSKETIDGLEKTKPEVKNYWHNEGIAQLVEESG